MLKNYMTKTLRTNGYIIDIAIKLTRVKIDVVLLEKQSNCVASYDVEITPPISANELERLIILINPAYGLIELSVSENENRDELSSIHTIDMCNLN